MAKNNKVDIKKIERPFVKLNSLFNDVIDNISYGSNRSDSSRQRELSKISLDIDDVISGEVGTLSTFTGDDISVFITKLMNEYSSTDSNDTRALEDVFTKEDLNAFEIFKNKCSGKIAVYNDIESVYDSLYELQEAVNTTRDSILTSDDISANISRSIKFSNGSETDPTHSSYTKEIEKMEKRYKLSRKIKDHIVVNTLKYGMYYVYTIPYSKLFEKSVASNSYKNVKEAFTVSEAKDLKKQLELKGNYTDNVVANSLNEILSNITVSNDNIPIVESSVIEAASFGSFDMDKMNGIPKPKKGNKVFTDGVVDTAGTFDGVKDCYLECIDPTKIIPIQILNKTIGYYMIRTDLPLVVPTTNMMSGAFNNNLHQQNSLNNEALIVKSITNKIVGSFDKKFLEDNSNFKELIANALMYDDMYKKRIHFQFIPADYITEFKVNCDLNNNGTSILKPSLFNAKLYLGIMIFKITSILTRSNDTRVTYVKQSGIDKDISGQVQRIVRNMKTRQLNFKDLFNYSGMMSKAGSAKDIYMPVGKSGERGLEFDILSGQQIDLHTDLTEKLRTSYISATGVPSVMMNYINEADYAKTLVMANSKYAARIMSYQLDLNDSITELYKKLARYSTEIPTEVINEMEYILAQPKSVNTSNLTDLMSNTEQVVMQVIKTITGENADQTDEDNKVKDFLYNKIMRDYLPMVQWSKMDSFHAEAKMEAAKYYAEKSAKETNAESSSEY